ncbi:MAG: hypothetical protein AAFV37_00490 [Pseudomonadota bacterium]
MRISTLAVVSTLVALSGIALQGPLGHSLSSTKLTAAAAHTDRWAGLFEAIDAGISAGNTWSLSEPEDVATVTERMRVRMVRTLRETGYRGDLVSVKPLQHDPDARVVGLTVTIKKSMTLGYLNNLEAQFFEHVCESWRASSLGKSGYTLRVLFEREERSFIFGRTVSEQACRRYKAYLESRA